MPGSPASPAGRLPPGPPPARAKRRLRFGPRLSRPWGRNRTKTISSTSTRLGLSVPKSCASRAPTPLDRNEREMGFEPILYQLGLRPEPYRIDRQKSNSHDQCDTLVLGPWCRNSAGELCRSDRSDDRINRSDRAERAVWHRQFELDARPRLGAILGIDQVSISRPKKNHLEPRKKLVLYRIDKWFNARRAISGVWSRLPVRRARRWTRRSVFGPV